MHRWNGYATFVLLVAHAVFQTLGYQLLDRLSTVAQLADFINAYDGLLAAIVALLILAVVVAVSLTISRRHLVYESWYFVHLYT